MEDIIGILGAMPEEVDQLCALLDGVTIEPYAGVEYHQGYLGERRVVVCCAGMGKANAAATTQVLITKFGVDRIVFSGIAGNMSAHIGIGDVVVGRRVIYHDAQDDMLVQSAPFTAQYEGDPELVEAALSACRAVGVRAIAGTIATGDQFVGDTATKRAIEQRVHPDCVEMEGAAVSQIAAKNGVPCVILRAMSDNADESGYEVLVVKDFSISEYVATATAIVAHMLKELA
ncbi:5'-methylthioadenosine/S-adenosylhomocysteine nucleosidase [Oscillospiraceae bacterium]|uniref:5'-methylthioadenosine/adenosylhomocysteine nucleosidase n=1 Tax=Allofournierella sp. TaxID=1940256 RepID=UPI00208140D7|nr:5'-methylthioadenosine/S-adenosylhomocysteine nucleosidase [Oscillospiraceae bacterium]